MLDRTPVAMWWLVGLLLLGVATLPLVGAETRVSDARADAREAQGWVGTTVVVRGDFDRIDDVRDVGSGRQVADAVYAATLPGGDTVEVRKPARRQDGVLRRDLQPSAFDLRVRADDVADLAAGGPQRAVEWGERLAPAPAAARQRLRAERSATATAAEVRVVTVVVAAGVLAACVAVTVVVARRPRRRRGWFAGTRVPETERDPDVLDRAAASGELPVAMALLAGLVVMVPVGVEPVSRLVLAGLVALGAGVLLAREQAAVAHRRELVGRGGTSRRRRAVLVRALFGVGVVAGLALVAAPAVVDAAADDRLVARGLALAALSAAVLLTVRWHQAPRAVPRR